MNIERIDSIVRLIKTLPESEQAVVLHRLMQGQVVQTELVLDLEQHLKALETRYQMSSGEFYRRFQAGELGDAADFFEWNTYYEMLTEARVA